jgi:hypothetical protein
MDTVRVSQSKEERRDRGMSSILAWGKLLTVRVGSACVQKGRDRRCLQASDFRQAHSIQFHLCDRFVDHQSTFRKSKLGCRVSLAPIEPIRGTLSKKFHSATKTLVMPPTMAVRTLAMADITALMPRPIAEKTCEKTRFLSQGLQIFEGR